MPTPPPPTQLRPPAGRVGSPAGPAAVAVAFLAAAEVGSRLSAGAEFATFWPAAGVVLAALAVRPPRRWPALLAAAAAANVGYNVLRAGRPWLPAVGYSAAGVVSAAAAGGLLRGGLGGTPDLTRLRHLIVLAAAAGGVMPTVGATLGAAVVAAAGGRYADAWPTWWVAVALGAVLAAPLGVGLADRGVRWPTGRRAGEAAALGVGLVGLGGGVFAADPPGPVAPAVVVPVVLWAGVRFGATGAAAATSVLAVVAVHFTLAGYGPYGMPMDGRTRVLLTQTFLAATAVVGYTAAGLTAERARADRALRAANAELEDRVSKRTAELAAALKAQQALADALADQQAVTDAFLAAAPVGLGLVDPAGRYVWVNPALAALNGVPAEAHAGRAVADVVPAVWPAVAPMLAAALADGATAENVEVAAGGRVCLVSYFPVRRPAGAAAGFAVVDVTAQRRAERAARDADDRFRRIADAAPATLWVTAPDGACTFLSRGWYEFTGQAEADALGLGWTDAVHPADRAAAGAAFLAANAARRPFQYDYRLRRADGSYFWALDSGRPWHAADGTYLGMVGSVVDITARKRAEEVVQESEGRLRRVLDSLFAFVGVIAPDGTLVEANRAPLEVGGLTRDDVIGKKFWDCDWWTHDPAVAAGVRAGFDRAMAGEVVRYDVPIRTAGDGRMVIDFQLTPVSAADGRVEFVIPSGVDVTARVRAEQAARADRERLQLAQQAAAVGTFDWDVAAGGNTWSPEIEALYGLPPGGFGGTYRAWADRVHPADRPAAEAKVRQALATGELEAEWRAVWPDGTVRWLAARARVLFDPAGAPVRMLGVNLDVTDRKAAERALRESEERLRLALLGGGMGLWDFDPGRNRVVWNDRQRHLWGFMVADADGNADAVFAAVHPDDRDRVMGDSRAAAAGRAPLFDCEFRVVHPDGAVRWLVGLGAVVDGPGGRRLIGVNYDTTARRQAEDALRQSEATLSAVLDALPVGVIIADAGGRLVRDNAANRELWGLPDGLPETAGWEQYGDWVGYWPDTGRRIRSHEWAMARALLAGEVVTGELVECERFDGGGRRLYLNSAAPVRDAAGRIAGGVVAELDVTDRVAAQRQVEQQRAQLAAVFQAMSDGVVVFDMAGTAVLVNDAEARLCGYPTAGHMKRDLAYFADTFELADLDGAAVPVADWPVSRVLRGQAVADRELRVRRRDTGRQWVIAFSGEPVRDAAGRQVLAVVVSRDVTAQKAAADAVRRNQALLDGVLDALPVGVAIADPAGRVTRTNAALAALWGGDRAADGPADYAGWVGRWADTGRPIGAADWPLARALATGRPVPAALVEVERFDGGRRFALTSAAPVRDPGGGLVAAVAVQTDVTDRVVAERAVREADRRKDDFLAVLAHELRNPLAPLRSGLEVLRLAADAHPTVAKVRPVLERQVAHLVRLIDDLLDVSRISRGKVELRRAAVDLADVVRQAAETSGPLLAAAGHALSVDAPPAPVVVDGDRIRLVQVVANLLNNAARYTPAGGRVAVAVERNGRAAVVRVADTGVGLAADVRDKVFEPFFQVGRAGDRAQGGLGIGLTLVKTLVELHGGTVEARSDGLGRGSEFVVRLPAAAAPAD